MTTSQFAFPGGPELRPLTADDILPAELPGPPIDQGSPRDPRPVVAVDHDQLVGVGWTSLDPVLELYFAEINVVVDHRRRGVGTALFRAVCAGADPSFPVCARVMSSQPWRRGFADSLGCVTRVRCPEVWIDPVSEPGRAWADRQVLPPGFRTLPLAEVDRELVIGAWASYYDWAHRPLGAVRTERLREHWDRYADGLDPQLSMITTDEPGTVVAFSLVTPDGWQGRTFVVAETADPAQPDGDALLTATVAASIRALARRGTRLVELEGHATDPHSPALARSLPPGGSDPMEIVELTRSAQSVAARCSSTAA
ncbi:GNAT family N-acetyltransferase [Microlunatus ginsengisoli]|uniref:GNAT family N-acetyltransferase n=1 Tax=Microlunatus ginsengisoli TaxID=363863 RepID=A0ABP7AJ85_9ACTN